MTTHSKIVVMENILKVLQDKKLYTAKALRIRVNRNHKVVEECLIFLFDHGIIGSRMDYKGEMLYYGV